jgi:hypothetical protein
MVTTECQECGAEVFWVKTAKGMRLPLNAQPSEHGNWVVLEEGLARPIISGPILEPMPRYISHHATCPEIIKRAEKYLLFEKTRMKRLLPGRGDL